MCEQLTEQVLLHGLGAVQTDCALLEDVLQELGPLRQTAHTETLRVLAACRASQPDLMTHTSTSRAPRPASRSTCWFKHRAWRLNCGEARGRAKRERGEGWETAGQPGGIHVHVWDRTYRRVRACVSEESRSCVCMCICCVCVLLLALGQQPVRRITFSLQEISHWCAACWCVQQTSDPKQQRRPASAKTLQHCMALISRRAFAQQSDVLYFYGKEKKKNMGENHHYCMITDITVRLLQFSNNFEISFLHKGLVAGRVAVSVRDKKMILPPNRRWKKLFIFCQKGENSS